MEQQLIAGLLQRGVPLHIAQGMVANMVAESGLNPGINEIAPVVPGSRGGYGLNQWTGPRRRQFEAFASDRGAALDDPNVQLDFTLWELQNTEAPAWNALQGASDPVEAARIYSESFLRPGVPNMDKRLSEAQRLAGITPNALAPQGQQMGQPTQPQEPRLSDYMNFAPAETQQYMTPRYARAYELPQIPMNSLRGV